MLAIVLPAIAIGIPIGLLLALIRWRNIRGLSPLVAALVSLFRAAPSVTLILLIYFAAPEIGLQLPEIPAAIATLTLGTMAYSCEIWRSALLAFPADPIRRSTFLRDDPRGAFSPHCAPANPARKHTRLDERNDPAG